MAGHGKGHRTNDELPVEAHDTTGQGEGFTPDEIAAILERWRPAVLSVMESYCLWQEASPAELEDQSRT